VEQEPVFDEPMPSECALLNYVTESEAGRARRSSIWRQTGEHWQLVFHQGTPIPDPKPGDNGL
jgi:hypothetical protein